MKLLYILFLPLLVSSTIPVIKEEKAFKKDIRKTNFCAAVIYSITNISNATVTNVTIVSSGGSFSNPMNLTYGNSASNLSQGYGTTKTANVEIVGTFRYLAIFDAGGDADQIIYYSPYVSTY